MRRGRFAFLSDFVEAVTRRDDTKLVVETSTDEEVAARVAAHSPLERLSAASAALMGRMGDASRVAVAKEALAAYQELDDEGRRLFFGRLRDDFGADAEAVNRAYTTWQKDPTELNAGALWIVAEPQRQELLRRLNLAPGATWLLVQMRADLLVAIREDPTLKAVDQDFAHLFASWFNRGFLRMRHIDWSSPATTLEKIMGYESVHAIQGWEDMRRRVEPNDRRIFAFFHPATGDQPLIFVEVALTREIPSAIAGILQAPVPERPMDADTAVFYSINNTQYGLKGVSFGNFLIKQVVADLSAELPGLRTFVTLSPAGGFAQWLADSPEPADQQLHARLSEGTWRQEPALIEELRPEVEAAAARYLVRARGTNGRPLDPTARFHLGNGASAWRVNWPADLSDGALARAHGLMVNYLYELDTIESNHEAYVRDRTVAYGPQLADALGRE